MSKYQFHRLGSDTFQEMVQSLLEVRRRDLGNLIQLMLLHEMVGYQIHEAVARGEDCVMPEEKFKELVWNVWRLIRGSEQIKDSPNQEIQSIYELATDRLVFLSGKGVSQSDVDFVIQPYREYFAANYMANHTNADPDKVFKCLVERGPYWQQVLRFFAAITTQAQRQSWAFSSAAVGGGSSDLGELVRDLPARRAVLFSLPEFSRLQFEPFRKIIFGCLPEHEWWTWLGQGWVIPIIAGLRSGDGWRVLWKAFKGIEIHGYGSKEFALLLFPRVIDSDSAEYPDFLQFVSSSLSDTVLARCAIEASLYHELPVDLSLANEETLFEVLQMFPHRRGFHNPAAISNLLNRLPRSLALRFLSTLSHHFYGVNEGLNVWAFMGFPVHEKQVEVQELERSGETAIVIITPSWLRFTIQGQLPLTDNSVPDGIFATYIGALFESLQSPDDPSLYQKAVDAMSVLGEKIAWRFRCERVLGPSPDQFESVPDWIYYKAEMRSLFSKAENASVLYDVASSFGGAPGKAANAWTTLLFHPSHWDSLISEGLVESEFIATLRKSKWAKLARMIKEPVNLATVIQYSPLVKGTLEIPFLKVMKIAVELHNRGDLKESTIASETLALGRVEKTNADEFHDLIRAVQNPSSFPASWASVLMEVALSTEGINLSLVADFWELLNSERNEMIWLRFIQHAAYGRYHAIVADLMKLESAAALDLSGFIASCGVELMPELSNELNRRAALALLSDGLSEARKRTLFRVLLRSNPTLEEAKLYGTYESFQVVTNTNLNSFSQIVERLNAMPQMLKKEEFPSLRIELNRLLSHREQYPPEISAAALDALIQLDVASCAPISETDWQVGS